MSDLHMQIANLKRQLEEQRKTLRDEVAISVLTGFLAGRIDHLQLDLIHVDVDVAFKYAEEYMKQRGQ